jgi:hypothetical protein
MSLVDNQQTSQLPPSLHRGSALRQCQASHRPCCQRFQSLLSFHPIMLHHPGLLPDEDFGDPIGPKPSTVFRLGYGNINGFSMVQHTNPKARQL